MPDFTTPGVYIEKNSARLRTITSAGIATAAFIGESEKGPLQEAMLITSYADFEQHYGKSSTKRYLAQACKMFFSNGGARVYIIRVAIDESSSNSEVPVQDAFRLLESLDEVGLVAVPGMGSVSLLQFAALYCQQRKNCFFIADMPVAITTVNEAQQFVQALDEHSSYAALYFPWLQVHDATSNSVTDVPPSGAIAAIYARTDLSLAVWKAPAGVHANLQQVNGVSCAISDQEQSILNPLGINVIRNLPGHGIVLWGSRTLDAQNSEFRYISVRRTAIFIEQSILQSLHWVVFEPNNETLWSELRQIIASFLYKLFVAGAFNGQKPEQAYFVKCDRETMTQTDIDNGIVNMLIGFAPLKPAEFVIFRIGQKTALAD